MKMKKHIQWKDMTAYQKHSEKIWSSTRKTLENHRKRRFLVAACCNPSSSPDTQARLPTLSNDRNEARSDKTLKDLTCQVIGVLVPPPLRAVWQEPKSDKVSGHAVGAQWPLHCGGFAPSAFARTKHGRRQKDEPTPKRRRIVCGALRPATRLSGGAGPPAVTPDGVAGKYREARRPDSIESAGPTAKRVKLGLWFFWGTQNVLLPNGAGFTRPRRRHPQARQATQKNRCTSRGAKLRLDPPRIRPWPNAPFCGCIGGCGRLGASRSQPWHKGCLAAGQKMAGRLRGESDWWASPAIGRIRLVELWWRMWPHNEPPLVERQKRKCARLRFLFLLLFVQVRCGMLGSDGLPWWPNWVIYFSFLRCLGSDCWTGAYRSCWNDLPISSPHWGKHSASTMGGEKWRVGIMLAKCRRCGDVSRMKWWFWPKEV